MKYKLIRITTVPISLEKLIEGQLNFMQDYFEVTAIASEKEALEKLGKQLKVRTHFVDMTRKITPFKDLKSVYNLYKFFKKERPKIVHTHTPKAGVAGMLAARLAGVPIRLHTVAGLPLLETIGLKRKILELVEILTFACATKVYPNSKRIAEILVENKYVSAKKVHVIKNGSSNGIDTSFFDPSVISEDEKTALRASLEIPKEAFVFIFVGRLVGDKGINELIEAHIKLNNSNAYLLLVGPLETELDPLLECTISEIKENKTIISVGYQGDVRPYFAISDALAFPSYREGFPNVVMQAGAMGLPAIVSNINGCNEIIEEGTNGTIIEVKSVDALYTAMHTMLEKVTERVKLKENSRMSIVERYQRKAMWEAILDEYRKQLKRCGFEDLETTQ
ncbi:glycosyltransferase family 4 protein [Ulvibacter antarcticus]|uniref:Glycosyltransferase involved in cell wall biosynthesis n=1 Tax=Ulvibacter antarcticus TaxID=442714 RepID=A0A3L9YHA8_9FLAO|nr:glycosyltransferase family 4 protein [Ulvibacter antarcticus]RMA58957.1 glycosyltransferase involved in cell wall biosynthesis [Ulvibacter antarcticus]